MVEETREEANFETHVSNGCIECQVNTASRVVGRQIKRLDQDTVL